MGTKDKISLVVETVVQAPADKVWELWTTPAHITQWNFATDEWHCPRAENNITPGGRLAWRMEAKDGSMGFDYTGVYEEVVPQQLIRYKLEDGREVSIRFDDLAGKTKVTESFEAKDSHAAEQQRAGWQAILDNFRKYAESEK
ncbi:MAG: SRPBCC family protein [Pontibacter sp.]|nr:SRPBCC family protein [Pontibacter sp.]